MSVVLFIDGKISVDSSYIVDIEKSYYGDSVFLGWNKGALGNDSPKEVSVLIYSEDGLFRGHYYAYGERKPVKRSDGGWRATHLFIELDSFVRN